MTKCWRCKQDFEPEKSFFWPNFKQACEGCVREVLLANLSFGKIPDKLVDDVTKAPEVLEAEAIIREGSGR